MRAGEKLHSGTLASRYGCGQTSIREALHRLEDEGLVVHAGRIGFAVAPVNLEEFAELTRAQVLIADIALRESIRWGDAAWEERLVIAHLRLKRVQHDANLGARAPSRNYDSLHRAFHSALLSECESKRIVDMADELFDHAARCRNDSWCEIQAVREHAKILRAAVARDVETAVRLLQRHIERTYESVEAGHSRSKPTANSVSPAGCTPWSSARGELPRGG